MSGNGRVQDKVAVITGAGSGIGRAAARLFAEQGARLALADVACEGLEETVSLLALDQARCIHRVVDVSQEQQVKALIDDAARHFGGLDAVCNNAGITGTLCGPEEQDGEEWLRVLQVNLLGPMYATKHAVPHLRERGAGAIVNTASVAGIRSGAGPNSYSASKAALINFTQTSACDLGGLGIRVNAVCPGLTETGMTRPVFDYARSRGKEDKLGSRCELRRYGRPEEIARAILFLASDEASYITGQALPVDGGNTASLNLPGMKV
ncbi:MAG TPA: SDR family NAD(P)-dependent oxidoreductase [Gammaproteobacteria bacterium]|nr:SDR family NAD(P)-dependent oxidoreductase [Gammaproteobacteria bacterium]